MICVLLYMKTNPPRDSTAFCIPIRLGAGLFLLKVTYISIKILNDHITRDGRWVRFFYCCIRFNMVVACVAQKRKFVFPYSVHMRKYNFFFGIIKEYGSTYEGVCVCVCYNQYSSNVSPKIVE